MKKALLSLVMLAMLCNVSFSQEAWSTHKPPLGAYVKLPNNFVPWDNPNKQTSYYYTPAGVMAVGPNVRVLPNSNQQDEIILCSWTANPNVMFGSANTTVGSSFGQGVYVTTNGGVSWYGTDLMPNEPSSTSDPAPIIDKNGVFVFTSLNTVGTAFMYGQYSTNYGVNWSTPYTITTVSSDKNFTGTDDYPSSPYYGKSYTVWSNMSLSAPPIVISATTNGGVSWGTVTQINNPPSGHYSQGADIICGPGGTVLVTWAAPVSSSPFTEDYFGFAKSTNGGTSWTVTENAFDGNGIRSQSYNGWGIRVNSFPRIGVDRSGGAYNGYIYIVTSQTNLAPAGSDADIVLHRSTDGGTTWSAGIRVNQDATNNGKVQFFPAIRVDENGGVNVVYYDNRNYPSSGDSCETYMSRSIDGGLTWTDIKVSDHRWKVASEPGAAPYAGDYIGITSGNNKIWPFWFDNKSGSMQAWTAPVDIGPAISHTPLGNTELISGNRVVNCTITPSGSGINPSTAKLYYAKNSTSFTSVALTNSGGTNWTANLPLSGAGTYNYYLTATDSLSRTVTAPAGAPANYYSFLAAADTVKPVITHTPLGNISKAMWPATVTAGVTDNIGIDSAWVRWYKNNTAAGWKQFKLLNTSGSTYAAVFNSVSSDVAVGDSIFYRIIAQDNSSNHNRDSSALIRFKITNLKVCEDFSGGAVPPTNWTVSGTYWLYSTASGYGTGTGSAEFNFWSATSGTNEMLTTLTVDPTNAGDSIKFDIAHALYNSAIDSMIVETSTNAGTSWTAIAPMYAGSSYTTLLCMSTVSSTSQFTPTAAQWKTRIFPLPTGTNKIRFRAKSAYGNNLYIDNICQTSTVTGVHQFELTGNPVSYSLSQNYPNPFNPTTKINFAIPKQGLVTMKIYDVLGREVRTLVNEVKQAGNYSIDFNATEFASGVYFYKLQSGDFTDIKRMILVK